jgi:putative molybdopterin biosynthesis protein
MKEEIVEEELLTPAEVAEILKVSNASAYNILKRGEIPIVRIGKMVRVRRKDLEKYIYEMTSLGKESDVKDASGTGQ